MNCNWSKIIGPNSVPKAFNFFLWCNIYDGRDMLICKVFVYLFNDREYFKFCCILFITLLLKRGNVALFFPNHVAFPSVFLPKRS